MKGLCETKDCTLQHWSAWSLVPGGSNSCPNEERERDYSSVSRYIDAINDCNNIGIKSCPPKRREERAKGVLNQETLNVYQWLYTAFFKV